MNYASKQDLIARFGETELIQRTDRTNMPPSTIDDAVVTSALGDAASAIDGYLAARYALPLSSVPPRLVKVAADMARYFLHGEAASDSVRAAYDDALAWLRDVSKGVVQLGLTAAGDAVQAPGGGAQISTPGPIFGRDGMRGF